jgi:rifampicin phosphotransferase
MLRFMARAPARRKQGKAVFTRIMDHARRVQNTPPPTGPEALRTALSRQAQMAREVTDLHFLQGSGSGSLTLLVNMLEKRFPGEGAALSAALQAGGEPSVTAQQAYALLHLAQLASCPEAREQPLADPAFADTFQAFIDAYGHRGSYETYFRTPCWREQPEAVLDLIRALEGVDEADLRQRQQAAVRSAQVRLKSTLPPWTRLWIRILSRAANKECNQREAARSTLIA